MPSECGKPTRRLLAQLLPITVQIANANVDWPAAAVLLRDDPGASQCYYSQLRQRLADIQGAIAKLQKLGAEVRTQLSTCESTWYTRKLSAPVRASVTPVELTPTNIVQPSPGLDVRVLHTKGCQTHWALPTDADACLQTADDLSELDELSQLPSTMMQEALDTMFDVDPGVIVGGEAPAKTSPVSLSPLCWSEVADSPPPPASLAGTPDELTLETFRTCVASLPITSVRLDPRRFDASLVKLVAAELGLKTNIVSEHALSHSCSPSLN